MKRLAFVGVSLLSVTSALAGENGFYVAGSVGQTMVAYPAASSDLAIRQLKVAGIPVVTGVNSSATRNPWAYSLHLGYQLDNRWAVEGGYTDLGHVKYQARVSTLLGTLYGSEVAGTTAWSLVGVGRYPLTDTLNVFGKLGVARSKNTSQVTVLPAVVNMAGASDNAGRTALTFGFGMEYELQKNCAVRVDWDRFRTSNMPLVVISAGVVLRF